MRGRRGVALGLVLGLVLVLSVFGGIALMLARGASREVDVLGQHLRAVAVGELGYAAIAGRLAQAPWARRWFAAAPDVQLEVPAGGGTYSYFLSDARPPAPGPEPLAEWGVLGAHQADLLVRATYERSTVVMFWRLMIPRDALDGAVRVVPTYFTFAPDGAQPRPADVQAVAAGVDRDIAARAANRPRFDDVRRRVGPAGGAPRIEEVLGVRPVRPALDSVAPLDGGAPLETVPYLEQAASGPPFPTLAVPPVPVPPPTPSPTPPPTPTATPTGPPPPAEPPRHSADRIRAQLPLFTAYADRMETCLNSYPYDIATEASKALVRAYVQGFRDESARTRALLELPESPENLTSLSDSYDAACNQLVQAVPVHSDQLLRQHQLSCPGLGEFPSK